MPEIIKKSWKKIVVVIAIFSFVGVAAVVTQGHAATKKGESKATEAKNRKHKQTAGEKAGNKALIKQSEQVNEQDEANVRIAETTSEQAEE